MSQLLADTVHWFADQCEILVTEPHGDRVHVTLRYGDQAVVVPVAVVTGEEVMTSRKAVSAAWAMASIARRYKSEGAFFAAFIADYMRLDQINRPKKEAQMRPLYNVWHAAGVEILNVFPAPFGYSSKELETWNEQR